MTEQNAKLQTQQKPVTSAEEPVTIGCYISLAFAIVFFSGLAAGTAYNFCDFITLLGSAGKMVASVTDTPDGIVTAMSNFRGRGGSGAIDGFMMALSMVVPGVMFAMGMITVFEHYGALRAAKKLLTPVLRFLIGVPGAGTLALIACLQSTDGGAALTRQLKDNGSLSYEEVNNFAAFQMVSCAPITNFITYGAVLFGLTTATGEVAVPLSIGLGLGVLLVNKFLAANVMRILQKRLALKKAQTQSSTALHTPVAQSATISTAKGE
jgi:nucleoside recognition membrane protein YjiH